MASRAAKNCKEDEVEEEVHLAFRSAANALSQGVHAGRGAPEGVLRRRKTSIDGCPVSKNKLQSCPFLMCLHTCRMRLHTE